MWFLVLLTFVNALADNDLVLQYRVNVGGFPVSLFDALLLIVGPVVVLLTRGRAAPTYRTHPALFWVLALFTAAVAGGLIGSVMSGIGLRATLTTLRNLISLPVCVWLGYTLMLDPRSASRVCYAHAIVGGVTALFVLAYFGRQAQVISGQGAAANIDLLRAMKYVSTYCGIAAVLLLYATVSGVRMFPLWVAIGLCGLCFLGQFATLSRSDWLAVSFAVAVVYFLLPAARRSGKVAAAVLGPPIALACLWVGLFAASAVTGMDFNKKMTDRVFSMLPGQQDTKQKKAWDTRLASTLVELEWWSESPLFGRGFGIHDARFASLSSKQQLGLRHNTWSSTLAETGLIGFSSMAVVVFGTFVVGRRMVRDWTDRGSVLVGSLGVVTASIFGSLGLATMAFNQMRGAIPLGIVCGIVLRCRAMQQTAMAIQQQQALAQAGQGAAYDDPDAYGNPAYPQPGYPQPGYSQPGYPQAGYPSADPVY